MKFDSLYSFWLLIFIGPMIALSLREFKKSNTWCKGFSGRRRPKTLFLLSLTFMVLAFFFLCLSLANPLFSYEKTVFYRPGISVSLGLDISKSMLAEDTALPDKCKTQFAVQNRLNRSRCFAMDLLSHLNGEKVGAFVFAGKALELIPLTTDYDYCRFILQHIDEEDIVVAGSDLSKAVETGIAVLETPEGKSAKFVILVSDGENTVTNLSPLLKAIEKAKNHGITFFVVGVGSTHGGNIPRRGPDQKTIHGYFKDQGGDLLKTRLDAETLEQIAVRTGGHYFFMDRSLDASVVLKALLEKAGSKKESQKRVISWFDISPVFLLCAVILTFFVLIRH